MNNDNTTTHEALDLFFEKINRVERDINDKINVGIWIQFWLVIERIITNIDNGLCWRNITIQNINQLNVSIHALIKHINNQSPKKYMIDTYCGGSARQFDEDLNDNIVVSIFEEIDAQENGDRELNNYPLIEYFNRDTTQYLFYIIFNNHLKNDW